MENSGGKNNEMSRGVWEAMETRVGEVRMAEAKGRGGQRRSKKKTRREGKEEAEGEKDGRNKKSSGGVGDLE